MRRRLRLFLIFFLELQVFLFIGLVYLGLLVYLVRTWDFVGFLGGLLLGSLLNGFVGGLTFTLLELYYSLRVFETVLDEEIMPLLEKIVKVNYRMYEFWYEQITGNEEERERETQGSR